MPPFLGGERYLVFGTELHLRCLKRRKGKWKPQTPEEKLAMEGGVKSVLELPLFKESFSGAMIETKLMKKNSFGIWAMHGTLDLNNRRKKRIIDLKTTSAETEEEFIAKSIKLSYPRQGNVYQEIDGIAEEVFFIGVGKKNIGTEHNPKYPTFIFDLNNYEKEKQAAEEEARFLLTFYKENGLPIDKYVKRKDLEGFKVA